MIELNEPQVWTLIGVFAASTFAMMGIVTGSLTRVVRAEIGGLRGEIGSLRREMRTEIGGLRAEMNARFERVDAQFERVDTRFEHIDRDIQALMRHVFPERN